MSQISSDIRGALTAYVVLLCKGLLDDDRWDWDVDDCNWDRYQKCFNDPSILRTTICVFVNNLEINDGNDIKNYTDARYRGFQYFRSCIEPEYNLTKKLESWELEEQDFYEWES